MRIKKAYWASLALVPATIIPLSTATSCSQAWGFKTPISIGTTAKGGELDPFVNFSLGYASMRDLRGDSIIDQLQSNFSIDVRNNTYYGYSLPEKWDSSVEVAKDEVEWEKGDFVNGNAAWYEYSSSDFVKSETRKGTRIKDSKSVAESIYSYRNNTLPSVIQLVGTIGTTISNYINYALSYQGTQIGTKFGSNVETDTNLALSWGGNITHGAQDSPQNQKFFESVFASNAISGTGKAKAVLHPTHVEFTFDENSFPIPAYKWASGKNTGVHANTLKLLTGSESRPSEAAPQYWDARSDETTEKVYDIRKDTTTEYKYRVYTYSNVPVVVSLAGFTKAFVDSTKKDGYIVSDYYSETKNITDAIGDSWKETLPKFATGVTTPNYCGYTYAPLADPKTLTPKGNNYDKRLDETNLTQSSFIVLVNYAYKEYENHPELDRVTMTGLNTIIPACFLDKDLNLGKEETFFKVANKVEDGKTKGFILDTDKVNKYNNLYLELMKRNAGQGLVTEAKNLNDVSKQLLTFLAYMFGDSNLKVDTSKFLTTYNLK